MHGFSKVLLLFLFITGRVALASEQDFDFARDVEPVLTKHCAQCHGATKQRGGFRVDSRSSLIGEADSGEPAIVPGESHSSELIRRIESTDDGEWMPPEGPRLSAKEIDKLKRWIDAGAEWPDSANVTTSTSEKMVITDEDKAFWSFKPLSNVAVPDIQDEWIRNEVDQFVLQSLQQHKLHPNPAASPRTLLRRISFDVIGLPPQQSDVRKFSRDKSRDQATEQVDQLVNQLLEDEHFGERWARHWMDVARYADSDGYEADRDRPHAYQYRDFVIRAFNDDLPFDDFVRWQIAGDELSPDDPRAVSATGFLSAGPVTNGGAPTASVLIKKKARYDELDDIVSTTAQAFLGLTLACARCHDHKFDPIPAEDYYRLVAAFATTERRESPLGRVKRELDVRVKRSKTQLLAEKIAALDCTSDEAKWLAAGPIPPAESKAAFKKYGKQIEFSESEWRDWLDDETRAEIEQLEQAAESLVDEGWVARPALFVSDTSSAAKEVAFLRRGDVALAEESVAPGFLSVLTGGREFESYEAACRDASLDSTFRRSAVAMWMTDVNDGAGALLARVIVNRIWQHYFGSGLVQTPNDFGLQGERPTHPELLDWLASQLIRNEWQLKSIHRLILQSSTYRQSTQFDEARNQIDSSNRWIWRRVPKRLDSESMRDAILATSGRLNRQMFGPPVQPFIPSEAMATRSRDKWPEDVEEGPEHWRRSVYIFVKRSVRFPMMEAFDAPDPTASCGRRIPTTVPIQALALLNNDSIRGASRAFADSVRDKSPKQESQVATAFEIALGRSPRLDEKVSAIRFLNENDGPDPLADLCQALLISNEFMYVE